MPDELEGSDVLLDALVLAFRRRNAPLPAPVYAETSALLGNDFWYAREAALAVGRLLRLGATADDLQAVARYAFAHGIGEAIEIAEGNTGQLPYLDATGDFREIASELWFCINETTSDDLAN
ncbi:MAG: hypothetical protein ACM3XQ_03875 [Nocardioidaceae bacterium]